MARASNTSFVGRASRHDHPRHLGIRRRPHAAVTARAAILIDNQTGEVLWQRNPDLPLPPASTTKIVTAMVALQSGRLDDSLMVSPQAAAAPPSKISLRPGWRMRLRDLVYALLLNSANDAAVVIAEGLGGSVPEFAERMNAEARLLGATNTHFVNPNGLPAANHYTTARDLATMFAHALQNPVFETVVSTKTTSVSPAAGSTRRIALAQSQSAAGELPHPSGRQDGMDPRRKEVFRRCGQGRRSRDRCRRAGLNRCVGRPETLARIRLRGEWRARAADA